jgi:hypothetical protein
MQNPQFAMQLSRENHEVIQITHNLTKLQASAFAIISPNVNFNNTSNTIKFSRPLKQSFKQIHISAYSSDFGKLPLQKKVRH